MQRIFGEHSEKYNELGAKHYENVIKAKNSADSEFTFKVSAVFSLGLFVIFVFINER